MTEVQFQIPKIRVCLVQDGEEEEEVEPVFAEDKSMSEFQKAQLLSPTLLERELYHNASTKELVRQTSEDSVCSLKFGPGKQVSSDVTETLRSRKGTRNEWMSLVGQYVCVHNYSVISVTVKQQSLFHVTNKHCV